MRQIIWTVAVLGALTAVYGLYQTFGGFPSWDETWLKSSSYRALVVQGQAVRGFGTMSSSQDYAAFMSITLMAWVALLFDKVRRIPRLIHFALIAMVGTALFYSSVRTAAALTIIGLAVVVCASPPPSLVFSRSARAARMGRATSSRRPRCSPTTSSRDSPTPPVRTRASTDTSPPRSRG